MTFIHLSEKARDAFFARLVKQAVLERVRGGSGLCYAPPYEIEVAKRRNKSIGSNTPKHCPGVLNTPLSWGKTGSLMPPQYTYRSEAFAEDLVDELNWRTENEA